MPQKTRQPRATQIDKMVGERIRLRRRVLKMSQKQLADKMGITFQQIQKYEKGVNCLSAGRLWLFSRALNVSLDFFFTDIGAQDEHFQDDPMARKETLDLVSNYYHVNNRQLARHIFCVLEIAAKSAVNNKIGKSTC